MKKSLFLKLKRDLPSSIFILFNAIILTQSIAISSNTTHFLSRIPSFLTLVNEATGFKLRIYQLCVNNIGLLKKSVKGENCKALNQVVYSNNLDIIFYCLVNFLHEPCNNRFFLNEKSKYSWDGRDILPSLFSTDLWVDNSDHYSAKERIPKQVSNLRQTKGIPLKYEKHFLI